MEATTEKSEDRGPFLSLTEAASLLKCHHNTVRAWVRQGRLEAVPMGAEQVPMYRKRDVQALRRPLEKAGVIVRENKHAFPIVGIGASAGGLDAVSKMLSAMPTDLGLAYVIVQHFEAGREPVFAELVRKKTAMPVYVAENGMRLDRDVVYVIPGGTYAAVVNTTFTLRTPDVADGPIDAFFTQLAEEYQNNAIGIVLSGNGSDGTEGLRAIRAEDGLTITQDSSALEQGMPQSALEAEVVELVLKPEAIGPELDSLVKQLYGGGAARIPGKQENEMRRILQYLHAQRGIDFTQYKEATIHRRIIRRMVLSKCRKLSDYSALLHGTPSEVDTLCNDMLINVTSFFRDPLFIKALEQRVFPALLTDRMLNDPLRIWVPACAGGEEVVSIAIALLEHMADRNITVPVQFFCTDLNERTIEKARLGIYKKQALQHLDPKLVEKYFQHVDGHYQVIKTIRDMCVFAKHDLLKDPPFSRVDLISCQNVLIYFEIEAQARVIRSFHYALRPTGFLALGKSESVSVADGIFDQPDRTFKVYTKKTTGDERLDMDMRYKPSVLQAEPRVNGLSMQLAAMPADLDRDTEKLLLDRYMPACILVNNDLAIVRFRGQTAPYLGPAAGKATLKLLKMVREDLVFDLRGLLQKAKREKSTTRKSGVPMRMDDALKSVTLEVVPVGDARDPHYLVLFKDDVPAGNSAAPLAGKRKYLRDERERRIIQLEQELAQAREQMRSAAEEAENYSQELQAANEEVVSSNEELQSINEELETSKEELQSINEEFATINEELRVRNEALFESEERFRLLAENMDQLAWMAEADGSKVWFNDRWEQFSGIPVAEMRERTSELHRPDQYERITASLQASAAKGESWEETFQLKAADGSWHWFLSRAIPVRDSDGLVYRWFGTSTDITERKTAEELLRQRTSALESINTLGDTLIAELDVQKIVQAVTDTGREVTGASFGAFFHNVEGDKGESYMLYTLSGMPREAFASFPMPRATELFGPIFRGEGPMRIADVVKDPRYGRTGPHHGLPPGHPTVRSFLAVPVTSRDGKVLGGLFYAHFEPDRFTEQDEAILSGLAAQAALALDNAGLHSALQDELEQQRVAQVALRESEERYRKLIDLMPVAVYTCDIDGHIQLFNEAAVRLWGRTPVVGETRWCGSISMCTPDGNDLPLDQCPMAIAITEQRAMTDVDTVVVRPDGEQRAVLANPTPLYDNHGKLNGAINVLVDITERKQAEADRQQLSGMLERSLNEIFIFDLETFQFDYVNQGALGNLGYTLEQMRGMTPLDIKPEFTARKFKALVKPLISGEKDKLMFHTVHRRADGSDYPVEIHLQIVSRGPKRMFMAMILDITERRLDEERLRVITRTGKVGIWDWDITTDALAWTDPVYAILGVEKGSFELTMAGYHELIHPGDRDRVDVALKATMEKDVPFEIEFRTLNGEGTVNWVYTNAVVIREHGRPVRILGGTMNITARRGTEDALRSSEQRINALVANLPQLIYIVDNTGKTSWVNDKWAAYFGLSVNEVVDEKWVSAVHPDDMGPMVESWRAAFAEGHDWEHTFRIKNKEGEYRWFLSRATPLRGPEGKVLRWFGSHTDVTDQREADSRIRESEERFRLLADNMDQLAWMATPDGSTLWFNQRWEEFSGIPLDQIREKAPTDLHHPDHYERVTTSLNAAAAKGENWESTFPLKGKDGKWHWFLSRVMPHKDEAGHITRWFGTSTDITEQKEAEEALEESAKHKDHFLATLSHELRNPLAPIKNGLQLLAMTGDDPEMSGITLGMMTRQVEHLVRLVDDLMDLSRISRDTIGLEMERVDLGQVIATAIEASDPLIKQREHHLSLILPQRPWIVQGDMVRLTQVVANLLNNSAKYTDPGGRIELRVEAEGNEVAIHVKDNGIGIEAQALPRVFDMFSQVSSAEKKVEGGLGIGLHIVKRLVDLHAGRIEAHSEGLDHGSEFIVRLPLREYVPGPKRTLDTEPGPATTPSTRRVLVVDDNEDAAYTMALILKKRGHMVETVHDGLEALKRVPAFRPQIVFMDIGMPRMNGYEACAAMRAIPEGSDMTIIALSGWGQEDDKRRSKEAGFDKHLVKPIDGVTLMAVLSEND